MEIHCQISSVEIISLGNFLNSKSCFIHFSWLKPDCYGAKSCYVIPKPRGYFHGAQLGALVCSSTDYTHRRPLNRSASYFDPLTKYCFVTQTLI